MSEKQLDDIEFDALRNAIYHSSRRWFFNLANRGLSFVVVAGGTTAVATIAAEMGVPTIWAAATAALGGLAQLVFDFGGLARTHEFLQRRFYELSAEISECPNPTEADLARWDSALKRLYAEEPPPMRALDAVAYNAALDSLGRNPSGRLMIAGWQSFLGQFWPFNGTSFDIARATSKSGAPSDGTS